MSKWKVGDQSWGYTAPLRPKTFAFRGSETCISLSEGQRCARWVPKQSFLVLTRARQKVRHARRFLQAMPFPTEMIGKGRGNVGPTQETLEKAHPLTKDWGQNSLPGKKSGPLAVVRGCSPRRASFGLDLPDRWVRRQGCRLSTQSPKTPPKPPQSPPQHAPKSQTRGRPKPETDRGAAEGFA